MKRRTQGGDSQISDMLSKARGRLSKVDMAEVSLEDPRSFNSVEAREARAKQLGRRAGAYGVGDWVGLAAYHGWTGQIFSIEIVNREPHYTILWTYEAEPMATFPKPHPRMGEPYRLQDIKKLPQNNMVDMIEPYRVRKAIEAMTPTEKKRAKKLGLALGTVAIESTPPAPEIQGSVFDYIEID